MFQGKQVTGTTSQGSCPETSKFRINTRSSVQLPIGSECDDLVTQMSPKTCEGVNHKRMTKKCDTNSQTTVETQSSSKLAGSSSRLVTWCWSWIVDFTNYIFGSIFCDCQSFSVEWIWRPVALLSLHAEKYTLSFSIPFLNIVILLCHSNPQRNPRKQVQRQVGIWFKSFKCLYNKLKC